MANRLHLSHPAIEMRMNSRWNPSASDSFKNKFKNAFRGLKHLADSIFYRSFSEID
jgi:hypothetical protein